MLIFKSLNRSTLIGLGGLEPCLISHVSRTYVSTRPEKDTVKHYAIGPVSRELLVPETILSYVRFGERAILFLFVDIERYC